MVRLGLGGVTIGILEMLMSVTLKGTAFGSLCYLGSDPCRFFKRQPLGSGWYTIVLVDYNRFVNIEHGLRLGCIVYWIDL